MVGPPGSQLPRAGDAVGDVAGLDAGGAEQLARALLDGLGQDRTEGLVALGSLVDRRGQRGHVGLAGAVDRVQAQLGGHVHEQLVTARGHAVGQRLGRVGGADLVNADLRGQGQQGDDGGGRRERQVRNVCARWTAGRCSGDGGRSGLGGGGCRGGCRGSLSSGGRRGDLLVLIVLDHGDVGRVNAGLVALDVEHVDARERELGGEQGAGSQVGQGRGGTEADLDDLIDAQAGNAGGSLLGREQHALRLDPTHRGRELPAQQLDEQRAGQDTRVGQGRVPRAFRLEQLAHRVGGNHVEDGLGELAGELEGTRHQVGDVAAHELRGIDLSGDTFVELRTEVRHAAAQDSGVEGHVNAGNIHEGTLATVLGGALGGVLLEGLQASDRTGNGVLLARQVEVDDLEELTRCPSDRLDVFHDVSVVDAELVRAQGTHAVVRTALLVAGHERVHRGTALEDQVEDDFEREDLGVCGQRVVLAQRVAGEGSTRNQHALFAHARRLADRERRERNLRELGEVQDAFGVTVGHAARHDLGRVVAHDRQDGEAHRRAGVRIGAAPDLVHSLGLGALIQTHARALDALAGVHVGDLRGKGVGRRTRDDLLVDAAGDLEGQTATDDATHALDGDFNLVVQVDGAVHVVRPAGDLSATLTGDNGLSRVLSRGRQPHAVHERRVHASDLGGRVGGVDRVVVARHDRKGRHVVGSLDVYAAQDRSGSVDDLDVGAAEGLGLGGGAVAGGAAADREALLRGAHVLAVRGQFEGDRDDTAGGGLIDGGHVAGDVDRGDAALKHLLGRVLQRDRVIEVDGVEQTLNDRVVVVDGRTQGRVDRWPGGAEQGVGSPGSQLVVRGQGSARGFGVIEAQGGGQREGVVGLAEDGLVGGDHHRQCVHGVAGDGHGGHAGGGREHRVHVLGQLGLVDDGDRAVFAGQNQREDQLAHRVLLGAARVVIPGGVQVDDHVHAGVGRVQGDALLVEDGGRVGHQVTGPRDEGNLAQPFLAGGGGLAVTQTRGDGCRDRARGSQTLGCGGLEAAQEGGDGLVDAVDASHRDGAGDDADLVGGVALVLRLPQAVLAPPADEVVVQDRDEGHRLRVGAAQGREPGGVDGGDVRGRGVRVGGHQAVGGGVRVSDVLDGREQGFDLTVIHGGQARLDALEQVVVADLPRGIDPRVGQVGEATHPGLVGHLFEVAEVGLGRVGEDLDDFVLAGAHLGTVGADLGDDASGSGRRVGDLVHVGAQVGQAGGHPAAGLTLADPAAQVVVVGHTGRGDEEFLDGLGGVRFLRGHRGGAHEDAVDRHGWATVAGRPLAGQEVSGALGGADAAAHGQDDVGLGTQLGVGGQQKVGQVLPGVVATGVSVFDLDDDLDRVGFAGDRDDLADLVDRAGLEGHVGEAVGAQLLNESEGFVLLGDTRGDDDAVDGGTGRART